LHCLKDIPINVVAHTWTRRAGPVAGIFCCNPDGGEYSEWLPQVRGVLPPRVTHLSAPLPDAATLPRALLRLCDAPAMQSSMSP
jgi:hypothetical protein